MAGGQDVAFKDVGGNCIDITVENGDLAAENGLETAVLISLFSDRFVPEVELPENIEETRGWWGDALSTPPEDLIGSRLWTFDRIGKINNETAIGMREAILEALQWMIDDGVAALIEVDTEVVANTQINFDVRIFRPEGDDIPFKFIWDAQELKRAG